MGNVGVESLNKNGKRESEGETGSIQKKKKKKKERSLRLKDNMILKPKQKAL